MRFGSTRGRQAVGGCLGRPWKPEARLAPRLSRLLVDVCPLASILHVRGMSGSAVISEMPVSGLPVEGISLDVPRAAKPELKSFDMNSATLNGLSSGRSFRTSHAAFPELTTGAS